MLGVHLLCVSSEVVAPETTSTLFFCRVTSFTARAAAEFGTSKTASTPSVSNHWRAMLAAVSGWFWWSAPTTSTGTPLTLPPKSRTASSAATTPPWPPMSA